MGEWISMGIWVSSGGNHGGMVTTSDGNLRILVKVLEKVTDADWYGKLITGMQCPILPAWGHSFAGYDRAF